MVEKKRTTRGEGSRLNQLQENPGQLSLTQVSLQASMSMRIGGCWARNDNYFPRLWALRSTILPVLSTPCRLKLCFAKSIAIVVTFMLTAPVPLIEMMRLQSGTSDAAGAGGVHIIR
jgi:hypothetical protein